MDPVDVLSGAGARTYGGRFAPIGTRAVYLSATDAGASKEVTARKTRLGGVGQISIDKYPRVVYAVAVDLKKALHLSGLGSSQAAEAVRAACLDKDDLHPSMELARELISAGIQGLVFLSAVGGDDNLVVYRANCGRKVLSNRERAGNDRSGPADRRQAQMTHEALADSFCETMLDGVVGAVRKTSLRR